MLGPPNNGSELVDYFKSSPFINTLFSQLNGPSGQQLGTEASSKPNSLGPVNFSLGIIAGSKSKNPLFNSILPSTSDGKVTVASTKLEGMTDHLELEVDHTFMMNDERVIKATLNFLESASFKESQSD